MLVRYPNIKLAKAVFNACTVKMLQPYRRVMFVIHYVSITKTFFLCCAIYLATNYHLNHLYIISFYK